MSGPANKNQGRPTRLAVGSTIGLIVLIGSLSCGPVERDPQWVECSFCTKPSPGLTICAVRCSDGREWKTCCVRCALRLIKERFPAAEPGVSATARDITTGRSIDLKAAFFVVGGDQVICCYPPAIPFDSPESARDYQQKHGGMIYGWEELYDVLWRRKGGENGR